MSKMQVTFASKTISGLKTQMTPSTKTGPILSNQNDTFTPKFGDSKSHLKGSPNKLTTKTDADIAPSNISLEMNAPYAKALKTIDRYASYWIDGSFQDELSKVNSQLPYEKFAPMRTSFNHLRNAWQVQKALYQIDKLWEKESTDFVNLGARLLSEIPDTRIQNTIINNFSKTGWGLAIDEPWPLIQWVAGKTAIKTNRPENKAMVVALIEDYSNSPLKHMKIHSGWSDIQADYRVADPDLKSVKVASDLLFTLYEKGLADDYLGDKKEKLTQTVLQNIKVTDSTSYKELSRFTPYVSKSKMTQYKTATIEPYKPFEGLSKLPEVSKFFKAGTGWLNYATA